MFETVLKFTAKQLTDTGVKAFGVLNPKEINFSKILLNTAASSTDSKKRKLRIIAIIYFLIGAILAFFKKQKKLFFFWPALPFMHK